MLETAVQTVFLESQKADIEQIVSKDFKSWEDVLYLTKFSTFQAVFTDWGRDVVANNKQHFITKYGKKPAFLDVLTSELNEGSITLPVIEVDVELNVNFRPDQFESEKIESMLTGLILDGVRCWFIDVTDSDGNILIGKHSEIDFYDLLTLEKQIKQDLKRQKTAMIKAKKDIDCFDVQFLQREYLDFKYFFKDWVHETGISLVDKSARNGTHLNLMEIFVLEVNNGLVELPKL